MDWSSTEMQPAVRRPRISVVISLPIFAARLPLLLCLAVALLPALTRPAAAQNPSNITNPPGVSIKIEPKVAVPTRQDLQAWFKPLDQVSIDIRAKAGPVPADFSARSLKHRQGFDQLTFPRADSAYVEFCWAPAELAHQPLYFDDQPLERYGQSVCPPLQPILSAAHFFLVFPVMPYKIGLDRTHDPVYTLGYYRVGTRAPCVRQRLPFELDAAIFEAGAWLGAGFIPF